MEVGGIAAFALSVDGRTLLRSLEGSAESSSHEALPWIRGAHLHQGPDAFTFAVSPIQGMSFLHVQRLPLRSTAQATGPLGVSRCPETSSASTGGRSSQRPPVVVRNNLQQDNRAQELGRLQQLHKENMDRLRKYASASASILRQGWSGRLRHAMPLS